MSCHVEIRGGVSKTPVERWLRILSRSLVKIFDVILCIYFIPCFSLLYNYPWLLYQSMLRMSCYNYAIINPASSIPIALHTAEFYSLLTFDLAFTFRTFTLSLLTLTLPDFQSSRSFPSLLFARNSHFNLALSFSPNFSLLLVLTFSCPCILSLNMTLSSLFMCSMTLFS